MNYNRIIRNSKAISPIFATLILIAIAVIAGVVVYMFTSGTLATMTGGGTVAQEHVAIQGASVTSSTTIAVYAQYMDGGSAIAINGAVIRDATGTSQVGTCSASLPVSGALTTVTVTAGTALTSGHTYTVTLTSSKGGSFVSPAFIAP
jgi:archaeal type IV pilus assembly protein PilA